MNIVKWIIKPIDHLRHINYSTNRDFSGVYLTLEYDLTFEQNNVKHIEIFAPVPVSNFASFAATVDLEIRDDNIAYLYNLYVHPDFRRKGIATAFIRQCEQLCVIYGVKAIQLHSEQENQNATTLYNKLGYEITNKGLNMFKWEKTL